MGVSLRQPPGHGGNITFTPGRGGVKDGQRAVDGSIIFNLADGTEFMRISPDGTVTVQGEPLVDGMGVYQTLNAWLAHAMGKLMPGEGDGRAATYEPEGAVPVKIHSGIAQAMMGELVGQPEAEGCVIWSQQVVNIIRRLKTENASLRRLCQPRKSEFRALHLQEPIRVLGAASPVPNNGPCRVCGKDVMGDRPRMMLYRQMGGKEYCAPVHAECADTPFTAMRPLADYLSKLDEWPRVELQREPKPIIVEKPA